MKPLLEILFVCCSSRFITLYGKVSTLAYSNKKVDPKRVTFLVKDLFWLNW